jgi:sigma-B regulation protein RsbU (phosphoserine phosphatase)
MPVETQVVSLLRSELANLFAGSFFLFIALIAFSIAAIHPVKSARVLIWVGVWSGMFGTNELFQSQSVIEALPQSFDAARRMLVVSFSYLILVAATLAFLELTAGTLRRILHVLLAADAVVAVAGITLFLESGSEDALAVYNQVLAVVALAVLLVTLSVPQLSRRFLVLARHRVLTVGTLIFALEALWVNVARPFGWRVPDIYSTLGFAIFLLSIGCAGVELVVADERRLLSLDSELALARQLQFSILPARPPEVAGLRIVAAYEPMTAVAGDFYEFLVIDKHRVGFLVADVSGHGVPAALIASMIKVAAESLIGCAADPAELLRRLGCIMSGHLRGQFVSASYLWIDTESRSARYSAAGHPPLLWSQTVTGSVTPIESNGLIFGVLPECEYPVRNLPVSSGDRFVLYTDGISEPENAAGEAFGDRRLEEVVRDNRLLPATELQKRLLDELRAWHTASLIQHDDITLIVIDVL